jgi:radical SAM superfamily enzyme YgiQ (UPF0313 family)
MNIPKVMMKILLVYPVCPKNNFWSSAGSMPFVPGKKAAMAPLGLQVVAGLLPSEWELKLIDLNIEELTKEDIDWADMVMISAMIEQEKSAREVVARCKARGKKVVAGGTLFFNARPEDFSGVDCIFSGEAELTMPLFLADLRNGELKRVYQSIVRPDLSKMQLPMPRLDLIKMDKYTIMPIQFSRGCPYRCKFCSVSVIFGTKMRFEKISRFIAKVQAYYDAGFRGTLMIVDDNFIGLPAMAEELLDALYEWQKAHDFPFDWIVQTTVLLADHDRLMNKMALARVKKTFIGIESINDESLALCNKKQNVGRDLVADVKKILRFGIQVMAGIIVGLDGDKPNIFQKMYEFLQTAGITVAMVNLPIFLPHTELRAEMERTKRLIGDPANDPTSFGLYYRPTMDARTLVEGFRWLQEKLFEKKSYYRRVWQMINLLKPTCGRKISRLELKAFHLSLWRIAALSHDWRYIRLLIQTAIIKIRLIPEVVQAAIMLVHYEGVVFYNR